MDNKSIMVAVDFGSTSNRALETAIELAQKLAVPLDLVNVCPSLPFGSSETDTPCSTPLTSSHLGSWSSAATDGAAWRGSSWAASPSRSRGAATCRC
jgi:universal stress protein family protein